MKLLYPIKEMSQKTGVPPLTLRAWERRYGLLKPLRSEKDHRLYCDDDIVRIKKIVALMDRGVSISRVAELFNQQTVNLVDERHIQHDHWQQYVEQMRQAIENYDQQKLDHIYTEILSLYPIETVTEQLLMPMLETFTLHWQLNYSGAIGEERFFSAFLRNKLGGRFNYLMTQTTGKKIVLSCLPGRYHEFPLLIFALYVMNRGYEVIFLGANVPIEEAFIAAAKTGNHAVIFEGTLTEKIYRDLSNVDKKNCPVFWRGKNKLTSNLSPNAMGVISLTDKLPDNFDLLKKYLE